MRKCKYCGYRMPQDYGDTCYWCGAPCPPRSYAAKFFISVLQSLGYLGFFFAIQFGVVFVATVIISMSSTIKYTLGGRFNTDELNEMLMTQLADKMQYILIFSALLTLFLLWIFMRIRKLRLAREIELHRVTPTVLIAVLIFGIAAQFAVSIGITYVMSFINNGDKILEEYSKGTELLYGGTVYAQFLNIAIITPILEETIFRGLIYNTLKKGMPTVAAVMISSIIFGAAHGQMISFVYAALFGTVLATLYERYDSIIVPMTLHFAFNGTSFLLSAIEEGDDVLFLSMLAVSMALMLIFGVVLYENVSDAHEPLRICFKNRAARASQTDTAVKEAAAEI